MKKIVIILLMTFLLCACSNKTESGTDVSSKIDTSKNKGTVICTRGGNISGVEDAQVSLYYEVSYKKGYITKLHSQERVISNNQELLDTYEAAYKNVFNVYKDLEHYTNHVDRTENDVLSDTIIEYDKIDMDKLKQLESTDESVIKDGKILLSDWLKFAEKFGTKCTEE